MRFPLVARTAPSNPDEIAYGELTPDEGSDQLVIPFAGLAPFDLARLGEILVTFARHGVGIALTKGAFVVSSPQERAPRALAVALRRSFVDLGPTFLKLGQFIASSPGLFPEVISDECCKLLEDVPPEPFDRVRRVVELSLGDRLDAFFSDFDEEPVAAASIAQVHRARLRDGRDVAVKVRRPGLRPRIEQDLRLLRLLATALQRAGAIGEAFNPQAIVQDFSTTLRAELDLLTEAANMAAFGRNLRSAGHHPLVVVPEPVEALTTERMLVMTYVEGRSVADVVASGDRQPYFEDLLRAGVRAWFESVFLHGFFHGDVHAGNLYLTSDGKVAFLDFGIMGRLDEPYRSLLASAVWAIISGTDLRSIAQAVFRFGAAGESVDLEAAAKDIESLASSLLDRPLADISYGEALSGVLHVATRHRLRLPAELVLVAKQLIYFERYAKEIAPDYKILADKDLWRL